MKIAVANGRRVTPRASAGVSRGGTGAGLLPDDDLSNGLLCSIGSPLRPSRGAISCSCTSEMQFIDRARLG